VFIEGVEANGGHIYIYNNLMYINDMTPFSDRAIEMKIKRPGSTATWTDVFIYNNVFANFTDYVAVYSWTMNNVHMKNNIFFNNLNNYWKGGGISRDYNWFDTIGQKADELSEPNRIYSPKENPFLNTAIDRQNFMLRPDSTPIDAGIYDPSFMVKYDITNAVRPQGTDFDIGPFEYISGYEYNPKPNPPDNLIIIQ